MQQQTLAQAFTLSGVGIHTGAAAKITVRPAPIDTGRIFQIPGTQIPAQAEFVIDTRRCTTLAVGMSQILTVEHLLSALLGYSIDNAIIEVEGPEIPILDGSALPFAAAIEQAGIRKQAKPPRIIRPKRSVLLREGDSEIGIEPSDGLLVTVKVDFAFWPEGSAEISMEAGPSFEAEYRSIIAPARTFAFRQEVEQLLAAGLARGGSLENALIITPPDGFSSPPRLPSEWAVHKLLDLLGDLALLDARAQMTLTARRPGHRINTLAARELRTLVAQGEQGELND